MSGSNHQSQNSAIFIPASDVIRGIHLPIEANSPSQVQKHSLSSFQFLKRCYGVWCGKWFIEQIWSRPASRSEICYRVRKLKVQKIFAHTDSPVASSPAHLFHKEVNQRTEGMDSSVYLAMTAPLLLLLLFCSGRKSASAKAPTPALFSGPHETVWFLGSQRI